MIQIAQALLFDRDGKLLIYLRDDKPSIPFPNHWDLIGGHVEAGETPEQALCREVREEIGFTLTAWQLFRRYDCLAGDVYPNRKFIYHARIDAWPGELTLGEGQRLTSIAAAQRQHACEPAAAAAGQGPRARPRPSRMWTAPARPSGRRRPG